MIFFRDIVLASNLKPLEKDDRFDQIKRMNQQWNVAASKNKDENDKKSENIFTQVTK